jgi:hypothetical protein
MAGSGQAYAFDALASQVSDGWKRRPLWYFGGKFPVQTHTPKNLKKTERESHTLRGLTKLTTDRPANPIRYMRNFPVVTAAVAGERFEKPKQAHLRRCKAVRSITTGQPGVPGYLTKYKPIQTMERLVVALTGTSTDPAWARA